MGIIPYVELESGKSPRLPFEVSLDLTYRCNNNCRHCWLWLPAVAREQENELSLAEIKQLVNQARSMGCRQWCMSGGEPMLRPDFQEIFDYITYKATGYSLNTNGSLITPAIAQLLTRKGFKMVALYGATAEVHDHITRNPGSFDATMQGFAYLKEAGAGFVVQIIPLRDNYHQFDQMIQLALSLSPHYRIGAAWLYLSAAGSRGKDREIAEQRLNPSDVVQLDRPNVCYQEQLARHSDESIADSGICTANRDDRLFASCIAARRDFHVDPYGQATFCSFIKDPALRYDLRHGTVQECWDQFIPSLANKVRGGREYKENCGSCEYRQDCRWCAVYAFLEHRRFSAPVEYLCAAARATRKYKDQWKADHRRFFQVAGITIQFDCDLTIDDETFNSAVRAFQVAGPGKENISIEQHFYLPEVNGNLGRLVYRQLPWAIYASDSAWTYKGILSETEEANPHQIAIFSRDHSQAQIYNTPSRAEFVRAGDLNSLALFPTDQIWLARLVAERQGCLLHSSGVILNGKGLLFLGYSEAGKSTVASMLKHKGEILCDDRNIVRRWPEGFIVYGTWSHGDLPDVSPSSAPLRALLFLEKANENALVRLTEKRGTIARLLENLVKPVESADWWDKELDLLEQIAEAVPSYVLKFDKSGAVVPLLEALV